MQNNGSNSRRDGTPVGGDHCGNLTPPEVDLEKNEVMMQEGSDQALSGDSAPEGNPTVVATVVSSGKSPVSHGASSTEEFPSVASPKTLSSIESFSNQCRVCQQEKDDVVIDLGCRCKGDLAKAHRSCIETWFHTRGSNKCEICQEVAVNVSHPDSQSSSSYCVWRSDPSFRPQDRGTGCFSPLWVAFSILIGGLLFDVLISVTLGVSALPVNIIIGVIVVLGLGTAVRLALEFCHEGSFRTVVQRADANTNLGYHPAL